jgi:hypothetical protein
VIVSGLLLSVLGMGFLALAMRRHHRQVFRRDPKRFVTIAFRMAGMSSLILCLLACAEAWGWPIGSVAWFGMLSVGALCIVGMLAIRSGKVA